MRATVFLLLLLASAALVPAGENWPEFRGPAGDGQAAGADLPLTWSETENVRWKTAIHGQGWSSPVIWENQIWMTTATPDGKEMFAICVDRESGRIVHDLKLFDVAEPREIHLTNSYASPTPVVEDGRVYLHFGSYGTACLDTTSGEVLWSRRDLECEHWRGPGSSPILFEGMLIVHYDGFDYQYVVALDKETGETIWKQDRDVDYGTDNGDQMKAYNTPIVIEVDGQLQLISPTAKSAFAYDPFTGKELWRITFKEHSSTSRSLYGHGLVYVNSGFGKAVLYAVRPTGSGDVTGSHVAWTATKSIPSKPSPVLVGDLLFFVHDGGVATCLEAKTGELVWQDRLGGNFSASPIVAGNRIYFSSHEGLTTVIEPSREFTVLATNPLDDGIISSPAVSGDALFLRTKTHLYRIEK